MVSPGDFPRNTKINVGVITISSVSGVPVIVCNSGPRLGVRNSNQEDDFLCMQDAT